jgi:arginase
VARRLTVLGAPSGAGACGVGQDQAPAALRTAGLIEHMEAAGSTVLDLGDSETVPWRPDPSRPQAQNLEIVANVVKTTAVRVADAVAAHSDTVLVLGGDCTVGIGTVIGVQQALGAVGLLYFDLHADLNTPMSARDGALDWMTLAHMLAIDGSEPVLAGAGDPIPLLKPHQVMLFAQRSDQATRFERAEIERLGLLRTSFEDVQKDPVGAARRAVEQLSSRYPRYLIHLDVDVVDFTDAPLSEHPSRNVGLKLDEMLAALSVLASEPGLTAITVAELNPHNASSDPGLLEHFTASFADAIA